MANQKAWKVRKIRLEGSKHSRAVELEYLL